MKKVKINSNNLISDPEINKVSLKYPSKTASLINKKIITLSQKKINSNKPQKEHNHKLTKSSNKKIFILKNTIKTEPNWNLMSILAHMSKINKKLLIS